MKYFTDLILGKGFCIFIFFHVPDSSPSVLNGLHFYFSLRDSASREFDKGYTPNWTEEIFVIDKVLPTKPVTYSIVDLMGEAIKVCFYEQELQVAKQQTFRIEKVLRRDNKRKLALVK